ncbi:hypothetical protein WCX18_02570 [Sulfurimonas sp. HSL1-2]|uniref:hypothetical protein n=1 Tax=Thiomicrolovo zhangzhouensis TaxID=3131933 RepID=UPI0031F7F6E7
MDKFISIGVNQGDAFYLERSGVKILVDGGRARTGFPIQFSRTIVTDELDVVVCTHADADHINGLLGYFESGLKAKEVWLPGVWTSRLEDLIKNPLGFIIELSNDIAEIGAFEKNNLEDLTDVDFLEQKKHPNQTDKSSLDVDQLFQAMEEAAHRTELFDITNYYPFGFHYHFKSLTQYELFIDAIDTAKKIKELAVLAYNAGAKIRWFEFNKDKAAYGGEIYLRPVNSQEIVRISPPLNALMYLYVSKANRESLVFYSTDNYGTTSVLFSADSDFSFNQNIPNLSASSIITAPHHGSEHNQKAYTRLRTFIHDKTIFVRSDGKYKTRPGITFKQLSCKKICTLCNTLNSNKQDITFTTNKTGWTKKKGTSWCHCQ